MKKKDFTSDLPMKLSCLIGMPLSAAPAAIEHYYPLVDEDFNIEGFIEDDSDFDFDIFEHNDGREYAVLKQ